MESGRYDFTKGTAASLVAGNRAIVTAGLNSTATMGLATSISVGGTNAFTAGFSTSIGLSANLSVSAGYSFAISKTSSFEQAQSGCFLHTESYVGKVGVADPLDKARHKKLSIFTWTMISLQTAAALASLGMGAALLHEGSNGKAADSDNPDARSGESDLTVPIIFVDSAQSVLSVLTLIVTMLYGRYTKNHCNFDANAVFSMDEESALFMGIKKDSINNKYSSGALLNQDGIALSTANVDLEFNSANEASSIIGFNNKPDADQIEGSRFQLESSGHINTWGKAISSTSEDVNFFVDKTFRVEYKKNEKKGKNKILLSKNELRLNYNNNSINNDISMEENGIVAIAAKNDGSSGSFIELKKDSAQLKTKSNGLVINSTGIRLNWGDKHLVINNSGVNIGKEIDVIDPKPMVDGNSDLQSLIRAIAALDNQDAQRQQTLDGNRQADQATRLATETSQKAKLSARAGLPDPAPPGQNP